MSVLATEDFAGSGALSASWTDIAAGWTRVSGEGSCTNVTDGGTSRYTGVTPNADHYAKLTIGSTVSTVSDEGDGPVVRMNADTSMYILQGNTVQTRVYKRMPGNVFTQLGSDGPAIATADELYLEVQGTTLVAKKNGTSICGSPLTDSAIAGGTGGLWGFGTGITADNFELGDFAGGATNLQAQACL